MHSLEKISSTLLQNNKTYDKKWSKTDHKTQQLKAYQKINLEKIPVNNSKTSICWGKTVKPKSTNNWT